MNIATAILAAVFGLLIGMPDGASSAPVRPAPADHQADPYANAASIERVQDRLANGVTLTRCADPALYQVGTGVYSDGTRDYAASCAPGGPLYGD